MAKNILATTQTNQYRLPEEARKSILSQTDSARQKAQIELQRVAFVQRNGCEFGQEVATHK